MTWQTMPLKRIARFAYGDAIPSDRPQTGDVPVYGSNGIYADFSSSNTHAPAIIVGRKGSYGKVNWSEDACFASDTTFVIDSRTTSQHLRWLYFVLQTLRLDEGSAEAAVPGLSRDDAYNCSVYVPPLTEQQAIADYLDRETAQIDTLVVEKEQWLSLLAEKRRALITHAVTRGLNPDAPMRESGEPWLGAFPAHWEVKRLKFLAEVRSGVTKGRNLGTTDTIHVSYLRVANVQDGYLDLTDVAEIEILPDELNGFALKQGDVLMNEGGDADKLGRGAIWDGSITPCVHQNHVFAVRCHTISPMWLTTVTGTHAAKLYFESRAKQTTNLASISARNISEFPVPLPSLAEQSAIVRHIEAETGKLDALRDAAAASLALLRERRAALIAAAVTGKIDVGIVGRRRSAPLVKAEQ